MILAHHPAYALIVKASQDVDSAQTSLGRASHVFTCVWTFRYVLASMTPTELSADVALVNQSGGNESGLSFMTACNDGTAKYCCGQSNTTCCGTPNAISILPQESVCTANDTSTDGGRGGSDNTGQTSAVTGLAIALGLTFLIGLFLTLWLWRKNIFLGRQLAEKTGMPLQEATPAFEAGHLPSDQSGRASAYQALHRSVQPLPYVVSPDSEAYEDVHRYSELDSSAAVAKDGVGSASPDEEGKPR